MSRNDFMDDYADDVRLLQFVAFNEGACVRDDILRIMPDKRPFTAARDLNQYPATRDGWAIAIDNAEAAVAGAEVAIIVSRYQLLKPAE